MVCLGFEPGAAGWLAQTKPWSYGGHPSVCVIITLARRSRATFPISAACLSFLSGTPDNRKNTDKLSHSIRKILFYIPYGLAFPLTWRDHVGISDGLHFVDVVLLQSVVEHVVKLVQHVDDLRRMTEHIIFIEARVNAKLLW